MWLWAAETGAKRLASISLSALQGCRQEAQLILTLGGVFYLEAGLDLEVILPPQPPECWDHRRAPPHQATGLVLCFIAHGSQVLFHSLQFHALRQRPALRGWRFRLTRVYQGLDRGLRGGAAASCGQRWASSGPDSSLPCALCPRDTVSREAPEPCGKDQAGVQGEGSSRWRPIFCAASHPRAQPRCGPGPLSADSSKMLSAH